MGYMVDEHGMPSFDFFGDVVRNNQLTHGAIHEASHALIDNHFGQPIGDARIWMVGEHVAGAVALEEHPRDIPPEKMPGWLTACVAGQVGEAHWMSLYKGVDFDQAMIDVEPHAGGDMAMFVKFGGKNPPITLAEARLAARAILVPRWAFIERHAITLFRAGTMPGKKIRADK
jgi:hypothetical protein